MRPDEIRLHPNDIAAIADQVTKALSEMWSPPGDGHGDQLLTAEEAAALLGVSERYVWKLGRDGALPRRSVGKKYVRFARRDVIAYQESQAVAGPTPPVVRSTVASARQQRPARERRRF